MLEKPIKKKRKNGEFAVRLFIDLHKSNAFEIKYEYLLEKIFKK